MENIVRTAYGSALQTSLYCGIPFALVANTTLNEKFGILAGQTPPSGSMPVAKYFAIGNAGHSFSMGTGGIPLVENVPHLATDAALYNHLPFALRATNNDLTSEQQANYALRTTITVNGANYFAYYLMRINSTAAVVNTTVTTTTAGVATTTSFVPTSANLSPTPPVINSSAANILESQYVSSYANLPASLTQEQITEILNAATILYGDPSYAIISEMAICSGHDVSISLTGGGTFLEAISVQVCAFVATMHALQFTSTGLPGTFNLGTSEPTLVLTSS